jgi:hypothetical protein
MATPILIAVGGSGQHAMLAYLRLARLCNLTPARLITVDADLRQGSNGSQQTTAALIEAQARLGFKERAQWEPIRPLPELSDPQSQTFESLMRPGPGLASELFGALFNPRQRDVRVTTGFHGHPAVAASTFRMFLSDPSRLTKLYEWIALQGEQRIVVTGSTFGGTGSGVMPVLTSTIKNWCMSKGVKLKLGGVIQVRWFDLGLPDQTTEEGEDKVDVTSHDLERNSSCLVEYYRKNLESMFHHAFLVGHHPHANRRSTGVEQQPEHPHAVNLLSGYIVYQLLHGEDGSDSQGLLGVVTPGGDLENHLYFPFGETRQPQPLARHIQATNAEIAVDTAVLNTLAAGPPSAWDVVEPYPPFIPELIQQSQGSWGLPGASRVEPASSWQEFLEAQREALRWLAAVREHSYDIEACQFSENLVPPVKDVGRLGVHEQHLPDHLHTVFHKVLRPISPARIADNPEAVIRRSFYAARQQLEGYLEKRMRGAQ